MGINHQDYSDTEVRARAGGGEGGGATNIKRVASFSEVSLDENGQSEGIKVVMRCV